MPYSAEYQQQPQADQQAPYPSEYQQQPQADQQAPYPSEYQQQQQAQQQVPYSAEYQQQQQAQQQAPYRAEYQQQLQAQQLAQSNAVPHLQQEPQWRGAPQGSTNDWSSQYQSPYPSPSPQGQWQEPQQGDGPTYMAQAASEYQQPPEWQGVPYSEHANVQQSQQPLYGSGTTPQGAVSPLPGAQGGRQKPYSSLQPEVQQPPQWRFTQHQEQNDWSRGAGQQTSYPERTTTFSQPVYPPTDARQPGVQAPWQSENVAPPGVYEQQAFAPSQQTSPKAEQWQNNLTAQQAAWQQAYQAYQEQQIRLQSQQFQQVNPYGVWSQGNGAEGAGGSGQLAEQEAPSFVVSNQTEASEVLNEAYLTQQDEAANAQEEGYLAQQYDAAYAQEEAYLAQQDDLAYAQEEAYLAREDNAAYAQEVDEAVEAGLDQLETLETEYEAEDVEAVAQEYSVRLEQDVLDEELQPYYEEEEEIHFAFTPEESDQEEESQPAYADLDEDEALLYRELALDEETDSYDQVIFPFSVAPEEPVEEAQETFHVEVNYSTEPKGVDQPALVFEELSSSNGESAPKVSTVSDIFSTRSEASTCLKVYIVQRGDSLENLAQRYSISSQKIARYNRLQPNAQIVEGTILYIPN